MGIKIRKDGAWVNVATLSLGTGTTKIAVLRDQKDYDKNGGFFYGDYWRDRDLTVIEDPVGFVTFFPTANGQTTESVGKTPGYWSLPAGTYEIQWGAGGFNVNRHQTRLVWSTTQSDMTWSDSDASSPVRNSADNAPNTTSRFGTNECFGSSENGSEESQGTWSGAWSTGTKVITITQTTWFKVLHIADQHDDYGFGIKLDNSEFSPRYTQGKNIYAEVRIVDLATAIKNTGDDYVAGTSKIATVKDVKAYDADGGTFTADTWVHRDLNTLSDPHSIGLSISGNIVTVPAGTYSMRWRAPAYLCNRFTSRLAYSSTSSTIASGISYVDGTTGYSHQSDGKSVEESFGYIASLTFSATTYLKIEQYSSTGYTGDVSGLGVSSGISGVDSIFTTIIIEDLATAVKEDAGTTSNNIWNVVKTDTQTITGTNWTEVSDLTQTVTSPTATTKFLITVVCNASTDDQYPSLEHDSLARLVRTTSSVDTVIGSGSGDTEGFGQTGGQISYYEIQSMNLTYLDTPGVGTHTYHVMGRATHASYNMLVNTRGAGGYSTYSQMTIQQYS